MSKDKEHSTDECIMYIPQNFGSDGDLFGIFSESIETRVKYPDNSIVCGAGHIFTVYVLYRSSSLWRIFCPQTFSRPNTVECV